ncbi:MAG: thioredoxin domain-containing protein [Chloroflexi bacterium]|nr:thioredoxin domain-containing protein [Chloroflexota bacterium]
MATSQPDRGQPAPAASQGRLIHETSPYLLQHAHNPVDWYPWGAEALARAQAEDKPILLSVGYSACHWCHVMAHESFEDAETAALMNDRFVNVKVDREERPDIDAIYMEAVQALTGHGGWPLTAFLTPDGRPFYGGTYYPPEPRHGMPGFRQVLLAIDDAWRNRRRELDAAGDRLTEALNRSALARPGAGAAEAGEDWAAILDRAAAGLLHALDPYEGGFGDHPKFPQPMNLDFLLQSYLRTGDVKQLKAVTYTLTKMARGGIYDQLGGGFHRYSTDRRWLTPHFEKMLYDNAQLARTYLHAWQLTGDSEYRRTVEETLDYVLREMTSAEGGFYSTQDADSAGVEGKFFLWTLPEVLQLLGADEGRLFAAYFDVTPRGNFHEGGRPANILHISDDLEDAAQKLRVSEERLASVVARGRRLLFASREERVRPGRDDKILAEWNGLMLHAFAEVGAALSRPDYVAAAVRAAGFVLSKLTDDAWPTANRPTSSFQLSTSNVKRQTSIRLCRAYRGGRVHLNAYLEDYAAVGLGLAALYEATFDTGWLEAAAALAEAILAHFADPNGGGFFQVSADHEKLVVRRKDFVDNAVPSGNSLAAELFLRLGKLLHRPDYADHALGILRPLADALAQQPLAFGRLLCVLDFCANPGREIAIVGDPSAADTAAMLREVRPRYRPNDVLALRIPGDDAAPALIPLLADRGQVDGKATVYMCRNFVCDLPVTDPAGLAAQLTDVSPRPVAA